MRYVAVCLKPAQKQPAASIPHLIKMGMMQAGTAATIQLPIITALAAPTAAIQAVTAAATVEVVMAAVTAAAAAIKYQMPLLTSH